MTARVSWSVDGIEPSVRERAEASARRAGMSLGDWLNSAIGSPGAESREAQDVAEIHKRLDSITRQVEHISRSPGGQKGDPAVARQLNDAISRLDARLSQISGNNPPSGASARAAPAPRMTPGAPLAMSPMDFSIAEIVARQGELDGTSPRAASGARMPPPAFIDPAPPIQLQPDFSGLERQLSQITSQIETLRRPDGIEQSIASFRSELTEIRQAITEALPRRAIESLEGEIRSLGRRIDETRSNGIDGTALSGIERALSDIYSELRTLKPAEQLAGFDDAIRNLGGKIDSIVRSSTDPATVRQLEDAIAALKTIVSNVASNEALNELAEHVQTLSVKVDQLAHSGGGDILSALEQRIAVLTTALEQRDRSPAGDTVYFDNAVRTISERLDNLQVGNDSASSLSHVEQRVHHLLERLEASENRGGNLSRVEEGLTDILRHLEAQRTSIAAADTGFRAVAPTDGELVDTIKRELSDIRFSQSETNRHTQDSLEAVHNTLGHVVDRLSQIEGDLRNVRTAPAAREMPRDQAMPEPRARESYAPETPRAATSFAPVPRPEMPNPAAAQAPIARPLAASPAASTSAASALDIAQPMQTEGPAAAPAPASVRPPPTPRSPIDPNLPPDHPLEPGSRVQPPRSGSTPSERIAASEIVLNEISASKQEPVSSTNFIQAARRAAQAAAAAPPAPSGPKPNRVTALNDAARNVAKAAAAGESGVSSKIRALLVGASVVVIVLGTVKMGMNLLSGHDSTSSQLPAETSVTPPAPPAGENGPRSEAVPPSMPSMTSPTPLTLQSMNAQPSVPAIPAIPAVPAMAPAAPAAVPANAPSAPDVTGSIATPPERVSITVPPVAKTRTKIKLIPVTDKIPETIGGAALRAAASKGEPGAAFEIGVRYAEGRGVAADYATAAKWYERAAEGGIVPAMFRLGTLYEKGLGLKKDIEAARSHYLQAAEKGSAKAMHNLAVLDADGGSAGPNYKSASQWFRKAAERGVADSQFNLGILYARGIGVEQNLAESFKWFSLAAAQGDADSGRKRDDIAKRLDPQSLAAAKLAVQTFAPEAQPEEATGVGAPVGGWEVAAATKPAAKPGAKLTARSAAKRAAHSSARP